MNHMCGLQTVNPFRRLYLLDEVSCNAMKRILFLPVKVIEVAAYKI